jgi:hypothetical protein
MFLYNYYGSTCFYIISINPLVSTKFLKDKCMRGNQDNQRDFDDALPLGIHRNGTSGGEAQKILLVFHVNLKGGGNIINLVNHLEEGSLVICNRRRGEGYRVTCNRITGEE